MTRINSGIDPSELVDQHLVAEYREIGRISTLFADKLKSGKPFIIPEQFCLGTGHMSFFLDKGKYIEDRFTAIKEEMTRRGFNATLENRNRWLELGRVDMYNDYKPTERDIRLVRERIKTRMPKNPRYCKKPLTPA